MDKDELTRCFTKLGVFFQSALFIMDECARDPLWEERFGHIMLRGEPARRRLDRYRDQVLTYQLDCENIARNNNLPIAELRAQLGYYSRQYRLFFDIGRQYDGYHIMRLTDWNF